MKKSTQTPDDFQMDLMDHLRELRTRLIVSVIAVGTGAIASYYCATDIFAFLEAPYFASFGAHPLIATAPTEGFMLKLKVSVFAGAVLVSPVLFYQLWLFVTPGMYDNERKVVFPFVFFSTALFLTGSYFCYRYVLPYSLTFFKEEIESIGGVPTIKIGEYLSLAITTLLGFGAVFELPLLSFFLARTGIIDHRTLIGWGKHAVLIIFVVAAVLTPPDVITQFLMAGPLILLYGISIAIAWWASPIEPEL